MTTTINASTSAGLVSTADTSGVLQLQSNGTAALTVNASAYVGVGTASPVAKFAIVGGTSNASSLATAYSLAAFNITPKSSSGYSLQFGSGPADLPYIQMSAGGAAAGDMTIQPFGGSVGVGSSNTPSTYGGKLAVFATAASQQATVFIQNPGTGSLHLGFSASSSNVKLYNCYSDGLLSGGKGIDINTSGQVIIGGATNQSTQSKLELHGLVNTATTFYMIKTAQVEVNIGFKSGADTNFYINTSGSTIGTSGVYLTNGGNTWNSVSDERMKTILEPIENAADKVASLRAVIGYYNNDENQIRRPFLIAQDVQAVLPEAVNIQDQETGTLGMSYTDTIPLLVAAIKELKAIVDAQGAEIAALKGI
jgi:hypothetical protein